MQISDEGVLVLTDEQLRANAATPQNLPAAPDGQIHPEPVRQAYANHYAELQKFKLKFVLGLLAIIAILKLHHPWYVLGALAWLVAVVYFFRKAVREEKAPWWEEKK